MRLVISGACDSHISGKLVPTMEHLHGIKNHPLKFPLTRERQHFTPSEAGGTRMLKVPPAL